MIPALAPSRCLHTHSSVSESHCIVNKHGYNLLKVIKLSVCMYLSMYKFLCFDYVMVCLITKKC